MVDDFLAAHSPVGILARDDLIQEALLHWCQQRGLYAAERGASIETFMRRVLLRKLLSIERATEAAKRGSGTAPLSLDRALESEEDDDLTLGGLIPDPGPGPDDDAQATELRERIENASKLLTSRQRRLIQWLYADRSPSDVSRALGVSRPALYDELRRVRQVFRDQGLEESLR